MARGKSEEFVWLYECRTLGGGVFVIGELTTNQLVRRADNQVEYFDSMEAAVRRAEKLASGADFAALASGAPWRTYDKVVRG